METAAARPLTVRPAAARPLGLLELLHPDGVARRSLTLGGAVPAALQPASPDPTPGRAADLIVLAPTRAECRTRLEMLVRELAVRLAPEGVGYVLVPRGSRRAAAELLRRHGLRSEAAVTHLPDAATSRYLLPLDRVALRYTAGHLMAGRDWRRCALSAIARTPGATGALVRLLPAVSLVARRPGARPLYDWLHRHGGGAPGPVALKQSWRRRDGQVVLHRFARDASAPAAIAKLARITPGTQFGPSEGETLVRLGGAAVQAGARVPRVCAAELLHGHDLLVETPVPGRPAAALLAAAPGRVSDLITRIAAWLERWSGATFLRRPLTSARLHAALLEPAELLAPLLPDGAAYRQRLAARCAIVEGRAAPLVAVHGDLTMWNVLVDDAGQIGVVDWEAAHDDGLPLVDFLYAAADAAAAGGGYARRVAAYEACFARGGRHHDLVAGLAARLTRRIGLDAELAELSAHACWLGHAAREHAAAAPGDERPFLEIARRVAAS